MYIEESRPPPGFKHITAADPAYNNPANTEFIITLTGKELGREINLTVGDLQKMAVSDPGLIHRAEYNLSNTTYWHVKDYEGIKLWDLLLKLGLPAARANDDNTLVSFSAWDHYRINTQFSLRQLANPDLFYYYEKSPLDIGTDRPTKQVKARP